MVGNRQSASQGALLAFDLVASAAGKDGAKLAGELFFVVDTLDRSGSLRRALTDPARPSDDKASLVADLFSRFDARAVKVVSDLASARWSRESELADVVEQAGVLALLASADKAGTLHQVEEELFRVERTLVAERQVLSALGDRGSSVESRSAMLTSLFGKRLSPVTFALVERKVLAPRGDRVLTAIRGLVEAAATRKERLVAQVTAAVDLTEAQRSRLATILTTMYGHDVQVNVAVDPAVIGGIKVQVGSEVVDGTIVSRLADARRRLVG